MAYNRTSVRILEEDYEAFFRLLQPDIKLPPNYRDWLTRTVAEHKDCIRFGGMVTEVIITPDVFSKYCSASGLLPSYFNLEAYAVVRSTGD
jgi:hypothetical protein